MFALYAHLLPQRFLFFMTASLNG